VGKAFTNSVTKERQEIEEIIEKESLDDRIVKLGFVPSDDLPAIYSLAETTLCLSYAEGFGFPALESMACGTSCVVSNCSSLIEIAGPSMLVDPENISDIVQGIKETLKDSSQARKQKNIAWANNFSWEKVAKDTANIYQNLYKNK
jgi:glycosyltransferase involved in cell wall biosynthesis